VCENTNINSVLLKKRRFFVSLLITTWYETLVLNEMEIPHFVRDDTASIMSVREGRSGDSKKTKIAQSDFDRIAASSLPGFVKKTLSFRMEPNMSLRRFGVMRNLLHFPEFFKKSCHNDRRAKKFELNLTMTRYSTIFLVYIVIERPTQEDEVTENGL
jgi:hypothetical protein